MDHWPSEGSMMKLAMENDLSETAFVVKEEAGYRLRWFTPGTEAELCGHATLAPACRVQDHGRILISGEAVLVAIAEVITELK